LLTGLGFKCKFYKYLQLVIDFRSECLEVLEELVREERSRSSSEVIHSRSPWVIGYQKSVPLQSPMARLGRLIKFPFLLFNFIVTGRDY
jgi:hypothetical protein